MTSEAQDSIRARLEEMPLTAIIGRLEEIAERRTLDWQDAALLRYAAEALRAALASSTPTQENK